jgi:putative colanic acid biosynthesis acetyltransferase WcaF
LNYRQHLLAVDPYLQPSTTLANRAGRVAWWLAYSLLVRFSPKPMHRWRAMVLRVFGAHLGLNCRVYPGVRVWAPWNLRCEDAVAIANGVEIYNPALIRLASHCTISQGAYLCGSTHDFNDPGFPMINKPITIGRYAWVCARAVVCPGINVGDGAVLGLNSVATKDLKAWTVYGGAPARQLKLRERIDGS